MRGDIGDRTLISKLLTEFQLDVVMHFVVESHVDSSINRPAEFIQTMSWALR